ncbi:hypothetical protein FJR45_06450 [Sulfurimonas sediminis]|uniref:Uncharacterized protein n=1 Tax=Sulfurimonas sediminis TaxID=2590020 RepID=A0A7M1B4H3_9BACT|nr:MULTISPECIES: hypothetical protein [Sulfurimonas]QOP43608.1 hypothetical protein FJR45_06450 [Sulfurimonas sediminis]UCM99188.1 hypothetical protein LCX93_06490 [Sulfurimonas sp. SWIR-19]
MERKEQLIKDIQNLLNSYDGIRPTSINPDLLQFMDEKTLIDTIDALLTQKEKNSVSDTEWLEQFKTNS